MRSIGQVLVDRQVGSQRPDARSVASGSGGDLGEGSPWSHTHTAHRRRSARCSVTTGGSPASRRPGGTRRPPPRHHRVRPHTTSRSSGVWCTTSSGSATWARCVPGSPGCFPGLLPAARRSARDGEGGFENNSADGGIEEFRGLRPRRSSRSATRRFNSAISFACAATSEASCSYVGASEEGSRVGIPHGTRVGRAGGGRGNQGT